jgi:hypothetical protein
MLPVNDDGFDALDFREDWGFHIETAFHLVARSEMSESQIDACGKCDAEIDPSRRVGAGLQGCVNVIFTGPVSSTML